MPRNKSEQRPPGPKWLIDSLLAHRALKQAVEASGGSFRTVRVDTNVDAINAACRAVRDTDHDAVNEFFDHIDLYCNTWQEHLDALEEEARKYAKKQK